jgi:outer membrane protein OmpA-like peptidoglycan-associated protein
MRTLLLLGPLLGPVFAAQTVMARESSVSIEYQTRVSAGQKPRLRIRTTEAVGKVRIELVRDDGQVVQTGFGPVGQGATQEVLLLSDVGVHRYTGTVRVDQGGVGHDESLAFEAVVADALRLQIDRASVDVTARRFALTVSRDPRVAEIVVRGLDGSTLSEDSHDLQGKKAGAPIELSWPAVKGDVARIDIKVTDMYGYFAGMSMFPWFVHIPHEEVNFGTDSDAVAVTERPKLEASLKQISTALQRYKELGAIKLFIAGHTDTQGNPTYNRELSMRRARAIAGYFRKRGLRIPIFFEGFGEGSLKVATPDETDEVRNRRVDYILSVEAPALRSTGFAAAWKGLK